MTTAPDFVYPTAFAVDEDFASQLDAADPMSRYRKRFHLPVRADGTPLIYLASHSLGLQPRAAHDCIAAELDRWARMGVLGHFEGASPWYTYLDDLKAPLANLVGGAPDEVVLMNGLTVNLHLLLASFYWPTAGRYQILIDEPTFPSDLYAIKTHLRHRGVEPPMGLVTVGPRPGEALLRPDDVEEVLERQGRQIALVFLSGINFLTGQLHDLPRLIAAARRQGCAVGLDLAHAVGNVELRLHDWQVDFAVWCTYKYLCGGPGAVGGCFVHAEHGQKLDLPRLAGWWGNDPATRFRMQLEPEFHAMPGAAGWQVSNPPILALAPVRASLALFNEIGLPRLRARSVALTSYLHFLVDRLPARRFEVITPPDPDQRGAQLSLTMHSGAKELFARLQAAGVVTDYREPDVIRMAPSPLYNTFHEVYQIYRVLAEQC